MVDSLDVESIRFRLLIYDRVRRKHSARKDVALDEVLVASVIVKALLCDRNDLEHRNAAWLETAGDLLKVGRPVPLADRLQHFDRNDAIVAARHVAMVAQRQRYALIQPLLEQAFSSIGEL